MSMVDLFSGDEHEFTLEHRLLNIVLIATIAMLSMGSIRAYLIGINTAQIIIQMVGILVFFYIYYLARVQKKYKLPLNAYISVVILAIVPLLWFPNGGSFGVMPYFIMFLVPVFALMLDKWNRILALISIMMLTNMLLAVEYISPGILIEYKNAFIRYADIGVAITWVMFVNLCLICFLLKQYKNEQKKVSLYIAEVERHKANLEKQRYVELMNFRIKQETDERARAEEAKRVSDEKFLRAFDASPIPMFIIATRPLRFTEVNISAVETFGYARTNFIEARLMLRKILLSIEQYKTILRKVRTNGVINKLEINCRNKDGTILNGLLSVERLEIAGESFWLCAWCDITQLKRMQTELKRLDRLNIVSKTATGLAHEIRNPMTTVRGFLQLMRQRKASDSEFLNLMIGELDRANAIITEFLLLAKDRATDFKLMSLNHIIRSIIPKLELDAEKTGHCITFQSGQIPMIYVDENQIMQLLVNIIRNGLEAMHTGGNVYIRTYIDDAAVVLSVRDEGPGITADVMKQIGTPFFTTKPTGTGLGLAACYSIAARHSANIKIVTGKTGTTFYIKFKTAAISKLA